MYFSRDINTLKEMGLFILIGILLVVFYTVIVININKLKESKEIKINKEVEVGNKLMKKSGLYKSIITIWLLLIIG